MAFEIFRFCLFLCFMALAVVAQTSPNAWLSFPFVLLGFHVVNIGSHLLEREFIRRQLRETVRVFNRLAPLQRDATIAGLYSSIARRYLRDAFYEEAVVEDDGIVERFPFAIREQRENNRLFWLVAALALAGAVSATGIGSLPFSFRLTLVILTLPAVLGLVQLRRRSTKLKSVLEISRFGMTDIAETGVRHGITWNQPLMLRNTPKRNRIEVGPVDGSRMVEVDYDRVGFHRAVDLIFEYGGFKSEDNAT